MIVEGLKFLLKLIQIADLMIRIWNCLLAPTGALYVNTYYWCSSGKPHATVQESTKQCSWSFQTTWQYIIAKKPLPEPCRSTSMSLDVLSLFLLLIPDMFCDLWKYWYFLKYFWKLIGMCFRDISKEKRDANEEQITECVRAAISHILSIWTLSVIFQNSPKHLK